MLDRVLIVGAGPTGLTAALELSRLGIAVRIIDKQAAPPTTGSVATFRFCRKTPCFRDFAEKPVVDF